MSECKISGCVKPVLGREWCAMHYRRWQKHSDPLVVKQVQFHGIPLKDRLLSRVRKTSGCWLWTSKSNTRGYGQIRSPDGKPMLAHRASWDVHNGPIPDGMCVLHKCDNPKCVRPDHLFLGNQQSNMDDMREKGRGRPGVSKGEAHGRAKLTDERVREIRSSTGPSRITAEKYGISGRQVRDIRARKAWKHLK